jgi:hypothetical protein
LLAFLVTIQSATAEPAHFWISASGAATSGPEVPTIQSTGGILDVDVWAQPATVGAGPYHSTNNPFKVLQNFSLNLVTFDPAVGFADSAVVVFNPQINTSTKRFEFVNDSSEGLTQTSDQQRQSGEAYPLRGAQGFSIFSSDVTGIGPICDTGDTFCHTTPGGVPTWRVASVSFRLVQGSPTADLFLQIGANGMNHFGESSASTQVVFGAGSSAIYTAPVYIAGDEQPGAPYGDRETTFRPDDSPDLVIRPALPGDYNGDGNVDAADYVAWRIYDGTPAGFNTWRAHFGETAGSGSGSVEYPVIPEPDTVHLLLIGLCLFLLIREQSRLPWLTRCRCCVLQILACALSLGGASVCVGETIPVMDADLVGSRSTPIGGNPGGLNGQGIWSSGGVIFDWEISRNLETGMYDYEYALTRVGEGGVTHWILELANPTEELDPTPFWDAVFRDPNTRLTGVTAFTVGRFGPGAVNPGMPGDIYGVKFDVTGNSEVKFSLFDRPVWGDVYARDGAAGGMGQNAMWNAGFIEGEYFDQGGPYTENAPGFPVYWIPRPGFLLIMEFEGDMDDNHVWNENDIELFALALRDREAYRNLLRPNGRCLCLEPEDAGDVNQDGRLDFDDIPEFAEIFDMSSAALVAAMQHPDHDVPEPLSIWLAVGGVFVGGLGRWRHSI